MFERHSPVHKTQQLTYLSLQDREYLSPIIRELQQEAQEREDLDTLVVKRK
jgi:hypothetical protein